MQQGGSVRVFGPSYKSMESDVRLLRKQRAKEAKNSKRKGTRTYHKARATNDEE